MTNPEKKRKGRKGRNRTRPETLEERILLSGTWVDMDTGDVLDGATDGNDMFTGTSGDDIVAAMGGNDNLFGQAGDDLLSGGAGNDLLDGGEGSDTASFDGSSDRVVVDLDAGTADGQGADTLVDIENVIGSSGNDIIRGDAGANTVDAGAGDDYIEGQGGDDTIDGGSGDDVIDAGAGDDMVQGGAGDDLMIGGTGNNTVSFEQSVDGVQVDLDAETATGEGQDSIIGFQNVIGSDQDDTILGDSVDNTLEGGAGNDNIQGRSGDDTLHGGAGEDTISGGAGNDVVDGGADDDTLDGGEGDDIVRGGTGNDTVAGGAGADTLFGDAGDDILSGGAGNDRLEGGSGNDQLSGGEGDDLLRGGSGNDSIDGGSGIDTVSFENATDRVTVDLSDGTASGEGDDTITGVENVVGSSFNDTLTGDSGDNRLSGGDGNDIITGGAGSDTLDGGAGNDTIHADADDTITGGDGTDTVSFSESDESVRFDLSAAEVEQVIGSSQDDVFSIGIAADGDHFVIDGGDGYNVLDLGAYDVSNISVNGELITVDLGSGESFTVEASGINHITADGVGDTPMFMTDGDLLVGEGESVQISGTLFSESETPTSFVWTQVSGPAVELDGAETNQPSFDTPELDSNTTLRFRVEVSDGASTGVEYITVAVAADNDPVVVDLGSDLSVTEGDSVSLNATVVDPEGYATVQTWEQVSGPAVEIENADSLNPSFTAGNSLESTDLVFKFTASDGETEVVEYITVHVDAVDDAAVVDAGNDFSIKEGKTAVLEGVAVDPESSELTYSWRQISGSEVTLTDANSATASFEAPEGFVNTDVAFELTVSDGVNESTDTVTVTINAVDDAPRFTELPSQTVGEHEAVELSASAIDAEGNEITYSWRQVRGTTVELSGTDTQHPTFTSPQEITNSWLTFEVTASDGEVSSVGTVEVLVNAVNDAPSADAGVNYELDADENGTLSASGEDPEGKAVLYQWTQISGPSAQISDASSATASFDAPTVSEDTDLVFQVSVTDGTSTSVDTVTVHVNAVSAGESSDGTGGDSGGEAGGGSGGESSSESSSESGGESSGETSTETNIVVESPATIIAQEGEVTTLNVDVSDTSGAVSYTWTQIEGTETLELSDVGSSNPTFTAPNLTDNEVYTFDVTVEDDSGSHTVRVDVLVEADNDGPEVDIDDNHTQVNDSINTIGSTSSDLEGQNLSYRWVQTGGPDVKVIRGADSPELRFSTSKLVESGDVTFELQVSDGTNISTDQIVMHVEPGNTLPTVSAGPDQSVVEGDLVQLTSAASDEDGDALSYTWVQTSGPSVELLNANSPAPSFEAPDISSSEEITFELTVSDRVGEVTDTVTVSVEGVNDPPVVDAGPFQSVEENEAVTLSSSVSDSDSENLTYTWRQTGGPSVTISDANSPTASFDAPEMVANSYVTFELEVSDGEHTVVDSVNVLVNADNDAPTLDAGPNFSVAEETTVQLSATANDPEGNPLTHEWVQTGGAEVSLSDPYSIDPTFESPNVSGDTELTFQITTTDGEHTVIDTVTVTVTGVNDAPDPINATTLVTEDTTASVVLAGTDPDIDQDITSFRIDSIPTTGTLTFEGDPVVAGEVFSAADIESGGLVFTPPSDYSGSTDLTFSVSDGEAWSDTPATQTILVVGDADAPIVTASDAAGTEESMIALDVDIALSDIDGSESIASVSVSGAPPGSILTDGVTTVTAWDGTADISSLNISDLQIIPAENYDQDFTLTIAATSVEEDSGDTATGAATIVVHVDAINDPPVALDGSLDINEDETGVISLGTQEVDTGDAAASFRIESLPSNGTLLLDGVAIESGDEISAYDVSHGRLTFEPQEDWSGSTQFDFSVSDGDVWSEADGTFTINAGGVADAPILSVSDAYGFEEGAIDLDVSVATADLDGSEEISRIAVSGAPVGSVLSDGVNTVTAQGQPLDITGWDLSSLSVTPASNFDIDFDLDIEVTAREPDTGHTTTSSAEISVHIDGVNDAPIVHAGEVEIAEDGVATILLSTSEVDTGDVVESVRIDSLPDNGTLLLNGSEVTAGQVIDKSLVDTGSLTFEPNGDWSGTTSLEFSAHDGELWSETQGEFTINVGAVADDATLSVTDASGMEDSALDLDISAAVADTDGSETLSIVVSDVPNGATLSAGTDNGDGSWTLDPSDLDGLQITPPNNFSGSFDITVSAMTTELDGDTATTNSIIAVSVEGVADSPALTVNDASGSEDAAIELDITPVLADTDGSETLSIMVSDVPDGATLSAGTDNGNGTWTLTPEEIDGLSVTAPENFSGSFDLNVTATSTEVDGDTATTNSTFTVRVAGVADAPDLSVADASGSEDTAISLDINPTLTDTDGSETLSIMVSDVPDGATLSAGTDNGDGTWALTPNQLDGLTVTPPENFSGTFDLNVTATSTEADGDTATTNSTIEVSVAGVADTPGLSGSDVSGSEDAAIELDISPVLTDTDGSETVSVVVSDVPDGATLSAGTENSDGTWTLTSVELDGLTITPPENFSGTFDLAVTATSTEADGDTAIANSTFSVSVEGVADGPGLSVSDSSGLEDSAIELDISPSLTDTDGSESLSIVISDVPDGATLSAGTENADGTWSLTPSELDGLSVTPPENYSGSFDLVVTVTSTEVDGDTASTNSTITVSVEGVADDPGLSVSDTAGLEDTAIALDITPALMDADGSETLSIVISDVPGGVTLSAGTDNGDGTWTLTPGQLDGLTVTPPADFSGTFDLAVTATSTEADGDTATTNSTFAVSIEGVADAPSLSVSDSAGLEDTAVELDITAALTDTDGSEVMSVVIAGVPSGATLSTGIDNGDGTWTLAPSELDGLSVTPPSDFSGNFDLEVITTSTEADGSVAESTANVTVTVDAVADTPTLETSSAEGLQNNPIPLTIASSLTDTDGSETLQVTIGGVPEDASLSAGIDNGDGTWTLDPTELDGLSLIPSPGMSGEMQLEVIATSTDGSSTATSHASIEIEIYPVDSGEVETDEPDNPETGIPTEIDWSGEYDLGIVSSGSEFDSAFDEIDETLKEISIEAPEMAGEVSQIGEDFIGEVMPMVAESTTSDEPVPPPSKPLFEFVRAENADQAGENALEERGSSSHETAEFGEGTQKEKLSPAGRISSSFTMLWGLVRSLGARDNNEDTHNSHHASRGRRD